MMKWVEIRYLTKRGQKQKVKVPDVLNNVDLTISQLAKGKCHTFTVDGVAR